MTEPSADPGTIYRKSKPSLEAALTAYQRQVEALVRGRIQDGYVTGRVKTARSLIRKLREDPGNPRSWASISDKVGVRVICTTTKDCEKADQLLGERWTLIKRKIKTGKPDKLFYPGIHLVVQDPAVADQDGNPIPCEIQIRTRAQDAWAVASHKLQYKGVIKPPRRMRRVISRLTVVVEMFDDDVHRLFNKRQRLPMYATAVALELTEQQYERVTGEPNDGSSDLSLMSIFLSAYEADEKDRYSQIIQDYCTTNADELAPLIAEHQPDREAYVDTRDWLFSQPEVIAVLERAHTKPYLLASAVNHTDLEDIVRRTCVAAGVTLPSA